MDTERKSIGKWDRIHVFMRDQNTLTIEAQDTHYDVYEHRLDPQIHIYCLQPHHPPVTVTPEMRAPLIEKAKAAQPKSRAQAESPQFRTAARA